MSNIKAKVIADSISSAGIRLTTFEIEYPRFILAELNTHRLLSKNSASSRAIPVKTMHENILAAGASPVHWGKNQPGMSAKEELEGELLERAKFYWDGAKKAAIRFASQLAEMGVHKQVSNRLSEPFQVMKTVITGTEWSNFYYLRNHPDAQPEFQALAAAMYKAHLESKPKELDPGEWHLPYVWASRDIMGKLYYRDTYGTEISLEDAKVISASCCAQVSYRKNDDSLDKAKNIFDRLINSKPAHSSPVEHQATPMPLRYQYCEPTTQSCWASGVTHVDRKGEYWSGNFKGWIQHRKLIPGEAQWGVIRTQQDETESI